MATTYAPPLGGQIAEGGAAAWGAVLAASAIGVLFTWTSVLLAIHTGFVGVLLIPIAALLIFRASPPVFLVTLLISTIFQNLFLALSVNAVDIAAEFQAAQAVNFIMLLVGGGASILTLFSTGGTYNLAARRMLMPALAFAGLVAFFTVIGFVRADAPSALAYLRLYLIPPMGLAIGLCMGHRVSPEFWTKTAVLLAITLLIWAFFEICWPKETYEALNFATFYSWKFKGLSILYDAEYLVSRSIRAWLNLTGRYGLAVNLPRLFGPNIHAISYAYTLAFLALTLAYRGRWTVPLLIVPLLIMIGAKGPIVLVLLPFAFYAFYRATGTRAVLWMIPVALVAYSALIVVYGLRSRDMHVLGLIAGLKGFITDPIGRGLGVGGNLSTMTKVGRDWGQFMAHGAAFALESAWGVLLYQMGVFCLPLVLMINRVRVALLEMLERDPRVLLLLAGQAVLMTNAVFQEEAFSPVAAGLMFMLFGLVMPQPPQIRRSPARA